MEAESVLELTKRRAGQNVLLGGLAAWLTVERVAYGVIALLALGLRLYGLGWWPLGPAEGAQALPAWAAAAGKVYDLAGTSPLLFTLQRLLFIPLGGSDALARWWPALLGGLATLLFYALRDRLGRGSALMAGLLWALSPLAIFTGRLGLGYGLVPPLALALLAAAANSPTYLVLAALALGLLLAAGSGAYTVLLIAVIAALVWREEAAALLRQIAADRRRLLIALLLPLGLGATFFFTALSGLAATADLLGRWVRGLLPGAGEYGGWDILRRLLISEPLLVGFGIGGLVMAVRHRDRFGLCAGLAAGVALLVPLVGRGRHPADLGLVVLPLTLLAGPAVARALAAFWAMRKEIDYWLLLTLSLTLLTVAALCLPSYFSAYNDEYRRLYAGVGIVTFVLAIALWIVYGILGNWQTVGRMLPVLGLAFALAWGIGQASGLNYDRGAGRRAAVLAEMPGPAWPDLLAELTQHSALNAGGPRAAQIDLLLPEARNVLFRGGSPLIPMLRWQLRDYPALRIVESLPSDPAPIVITPAQKELAPGEFYSGVNLNLLERWRPESLKGFKSWLRWILYREASTPATVQEMVFWAAHTEKPNDKE
jgi:hypothetical protein